MIELDLSVGDSIELTQTLYDVAHAGALGIIQSFGNDSGAWVDFGDDTNVDINPLVRRKLWYVDYENLATVTKY